MESIAKKGAPPATTEAHAQFRGQRKSSSIGGGGGRKGVKAEGTDRISEDLFDDYEHTSRHIADDAIGRGKERESGRGFYREDNYDATTVSADSLAATAGRHVNGGEGVSHRSLAASASADEDAVALYRDADEGIGRKQGTVYALQITLRHLSYISTSLTIKSFHSPHTIIC
jgi:hypothetical protein